MLAHLSSHTQMWIVIGIVVAWHIDLWVTVAVLIYQANKTRRALVKTCQQGYDAYARAYAVLKGEATL